MKSALTRLRLPLPLMGPEKVTRPVVGAPLFTAAMVMVAAPPPAATVRELAAVMVGAPTPASELVKVMRNALGPAAVTDVATTSAPPLPVLGMTWLVLPRLPAPVGPALVVSSAFRAAWMLAARATGLESQAMAPVVEPL